MSAQLQGADSSWTRDGDEQPLFFSGAAGDLFGVLHRPLGDDRAQGFVFCHAFGEEKLWAHRVFVSYARSLTRRGYTVLRFDFSGHGDSDGDFPLTTIESREQDLEAALGCLKEAVPGMGRVGVLGLRLGASVALRVAARRADLAPVILWDPIVDGAGYVQELLRSNLATQMAIHGKVEVTREDMLASLDQGARLNVDGYEMSKTMVDSFSALDVVGPAAALTAPTHLVQVGRAPKRRIEELAALAGHMGRAHYESVMEEPFWREIKRFYERADALFGATDAWLGSVDA
jgi:exosortase A-associated hydrolase 2